MRLGVYFIETDYDKNEEVWHRIALYDFDAGEWQEGSAPRIIKKIPPWCDDPEQFQNRLADHHHRVAQPETVADEPNIQEVVDLSGPPVKETLRDRATEGYLPTTDDERRWQPVYRLLTPDGYNRLLEMDEGGRQQFLDRVALMSPSDRKAAVRAFANGHWPDLTSSHD